MVSVRGPVCRSPADIQAAACPLPFSYRYRRTTSGRSRLCACSKGGGVGLEFQRSFASNTLLLTAYELVMYAVSGLALIPLRRTTHLRKELVVVGAGPVGLAAAALWADHALPARGSLGSGLRLLVDQGLVDLPRTSRFEPCAYDRAEPASNWSPGRPAARNGGSPPPARRGRADPPGARLLRHRHEELRSRPRLPARHRLRTGPLGGGRAGLPAR
ncbi:hypothetical protein [Nonomuraea harbinensis]|uniref:FAD/NAD(P)-binding domain-containing protein n=1 Tax=Nonomuraea harbinensis TaxID=1286938 RepID=A0ABW1BNC5_9ACTN|nr:hypothetical protein [Nonomuraea harbinensis]